MTTTTTASSGASSQRTATWCSRPSGPRTANHPFVSVAADDDADARFPPTRALAAANNFLRLARTLSATSAATSASAPATKHAITRTVAPRSTTESTVPPRSQSDDDDVALYSRDIPDRSRVQPRRKRTKKIPTFPPRVRSRARPRTTPKRARDARRAKKREKGRKRVSSTRFCPNDRSVARRRRRRGEGNLTRARSETKTTRALSRAHRVGSRRPWTARAVVSSRERVSERKRRVGRGVGRRYLWYVYTVLNMRFWFINRRARSEARDGRD